MKNSKISYLIVLCCVLLAFTCGFFLGRNANHTQIQVDNTFQSSSATTESTQATLPQKININTASVQQLQTLPGIGPVLAQRIYDYRTAHGNFFSVGGLMDVEGIGQKTLDAILDYITVGG